MSTLPPSSPSKDSPVDIALTKVAHLDSTLLTEFALLVKSFEDYFLIPRMESAVLEREGSPSRQLYFAKLSPGARDIVRKEFADMVEKATTEYFGIVEGFLPTLV